MNIPKPGYFEKGRNEFDLCTYVTAQNDLTRYRSSFLSVPRAFNSRARLKKV